MRRASSERRYSVHLTHRYAWPRKGKRPAVPRVEYFSDKTTAVEEALLLAMRQRGVAVVNDEIDEETIAIMDSKKKGGEMVQLRNNPVHKITTGVFVSGVPSGYYEVRVYASRWTWYALWAAGYKKPTHAEIIEAWREDTNSGRRTSKNWERF